MCAYTHCTLNEANQLQELNGFFVLGENDLFKPVVVSFFAWSICRSDLTGDPDPAPRVGVTGPYLAAERGWDWAAQSQ